MRIQVVRLLNYAHTLAGIHAHSQTHTLLLRGRAERIFFGSHTITQAEYTS